MAGQPKKKISHANQGARRSHLALRAPSLSACPQCKTLRPPHQVCRNCGTYRGRQVVAIKAKRTAAT